MYQPDGERREWWQALKNALGTASSSFVNASLLQLQAAARLPDGPLSEVTMNAALAMIEAAAPQNEMEGTLAVQMACTRCTAMYVLSRVNGCTHRSIIANSAAAAKLSAGVHHDHVAVYPQAPSQRRISSLSMSSMCISTIRDEP